MEIHIQQVIEPPKIPVYLTEDEAKLFIEFQKRYQVMAHLLGYMDSLNIFELKNCSVVMDIDNLGKVSHTAITRHYRA